MSPVQHQQQISVFLYEAGIICSRLEGGSLEYNSSGENVINPTWNGVSFFHIKGSSFEDKRSEDLNGRSCHGQDICVIFSQEPGRSAGPNHNSRETRSMTG